MEFPYVDNAVKEIKSQFPVHKTTENKSDVSYVSGSFVSLNENGERYYSSDGKNWNPLTMARDIFEWMNRKS